MRTRFIVVAMLLLGACDKSRTRRLQHDCVMQLYDESAKVTLTNPIAARLEFGIGLIVLEMGGNPCADLGKLAK